MNAIQTAILEYIKRNDGTSYVEIERIFDEHHFEWRGDLLSCSDICESVVFWEGWNAEALGMVGELIRNGQVIREPASTLIYLIDGKMLRYPLVKQNRQYKTDHWLPTVFRLTEKVRRGRK